MGLGIPKIKIMWLQFHLDMWNTMWSENRTLEDLEIYREMKYESNS